MAFAPSARKPVAIMPRLLTSHLPAFDRVAQHAAQAETVTSVFRRGAVLDAALGELRTLQLSLTTAVDQPALDFQPSFLRGLLLPVGRRKSYAAEFLNVAAAFG